jgi:hypothetical protein
MFRSLEKDILYRLTILSACFVQLDEEESLRGTMGLLKVGGISPD